jgi:hypothetical protein
MLIDCTRRRMEPVRRRARVNFPLIVALWLYAAGVACADEPARTGGGPRAEQLYPLFHIAKSNSYNEVHYAGVLNPDCRFAADPVRVFWRRRIDLQRGTWPLDWTEENFAYGVRLLQTEPQRISFTLAADDTRPVQLEAYRSQGGCRLRARLRILGDWAEPSSAHITIVESVLPWPKVTHVDLHGRREDGTPLCERMQTLRTPGAPCGATR